MTTRHALLLHAGLVAAFSSILFAPARATTYTWIPAVSGPWDTTTANWNDGVTNPTTWVNGNDALFTGTGGYTVTMSTGLSASSLQLTTTSGTINFNTNSLDVPNISTGAASIDMFSKITGSHGLTFNSTGAGRLNIKVANDYTGDTFLTGSAFMLSDNVNNSLPTGTTLNMVAGTTFRLSKNNLTQELAGLAGTGGTVTATTSGNILTINTKASTTTTYAGVITSSTGLSLVIKGSGTQELTGNNTYTGLTDVQSGTLKLNRNGGTIANTAAVQVSGGTLDVAQSDTVGAVTLSSGTISGTGTLTGSSYSLTNTGTISAVLAGSGVVLTKTGAGTATLSGNNTYTGATTVSEGTLALGASNRIANTSNLVMAGGTFATGGFSETLGTLTLSAASTIDLGAGASALVFADSSGTTWGSSVTLSFVNFTEGTDSIRVGTTAGGLTSGQLGQITINGFAATIDGSGFLAIAAIPEPSTYAVLAAAPILGFAAVRRRGRRT